ncbi:cardiomyopathy-associated protein 5-like isoform X1 [Mobula birostris]|uniref:cardiomyopathy-associated protein 5-like isoform X1 n=1 Tax=Mobula birostris TaxID=1983395 RepID=UPI003B28AE78
MEAKMEDLDALDACISAETDKIEPEISLLEDEVCEGGVLEPEEEEKLVESLKEVIKDKSVKPKVNYIMSSSSFSMLAVQSEDCGIIWETVSSSRCSTPWASESTASDVYSVESTPLSSPPGKVIFITDELSQCSSVNEHQSNKKSKSEKHRVEAMDLRPGDTLEMARNNLCVLRTQADKVQQVGMDKMTNSKLLKETNKTEVYSQPLIEHRPVLSKLARKPSEDENVMHEVSATSEDVVQHHAPVHCRRKHHKNTVEQDENSVKLKDSCLINSFSTRPDQQVSIPPAKLRKQGESETLKHFSDTGLISASPECKDSRLSVETSTEPVRISHLKETCKDTELFSSPSKMVISNGTIPTGKGDLQNIKIASDYGPPFSHETSIPDCKKLASDMELTSVPFEDRSHLNRSPAGNTLTKTILHSFPEKQEIMIKEDQAYSMANPEVNFLGMPITISSELTKPMGSAESGIPYKGTDNFGSVIKDECVEAADVNLQNLSFTPTVGMVAGMETPQSSERHEAEIQEKPFYSMANPETLEAPNGSLHRTPEDACLSRLVDLEDKLQLEEDSKIQKAVFNIVAEGSEILNIIAPANLCSVDQEECRKMQDNLMYLQVNPNIEKKYLEGDIASTDSFNRMKDAQQSRLLGASQHCEQHLNPQNLWDSFTVGKSIPSSVVHAEHIHVTGSNPSNVAGSNPSDAIRTNPTHEIETHASHRLGSNPHTISSNPSHGSESKPTSVETPNSSTATVSNPTSTEQSTAVDKSAKKSGTKEYDYFEKYTLVDERVPIDPVTIGHKVWELPVPEVENPSVRNLEMGLSAEEKELFNFDEFDVSGNPGSYDDTTEFSVQTPKPEPLRKREEGDIAGIFYHKEAGSLLFDTTEGILSRSHCFPISTKLVDLTLLEEPPALAFYYKDLYEEAKGRRDQNNDQSDEDSSNPELSFHCHSSDTDEGNGLYFEKYILKDDILDLPRGMKPEQSPCWSEALPQNVAVEAERISLFLESEEQFPAIDIDEAEVPMQERDSEKVLKLQKEYEEKSMEEHEDQKVLSETLSITCEKVSEELSMAVEQKEENANEMASKETLDIHIFPVEETLYVKEKLSADVEDHLDTGHLVNLDYSFDKYGNLSSETGLDINYNLPALEIKDTQECVSSKKADIYQNEFDVLEKEQSVQQKFRIEDEQAPAELGQETDQECIKPSRNIEDTAHDEIIIGEHILETEEIAPQPGTEEYGKTDYTARMDEEICKGVQKEDFGLNDRTLHSESTEVPIPVDEMETSDVEIIDLQSIESISKEKVNIETEDQRNTIDETGFEENNDVTLSQVNNYEIIPAFTEQLQEEECLTGDTVQPMQNKYESPKMPSSEILTDVITYERESKHIFDDIQTEQDAHRIISETQDHEIEVPQEHCPLEMIQNKVDINDKAYLHDSREDLLVKDVEEESKDLSLMEDVKIIEDERNQAELDSLEFTDKELEEINQEETQESSLQKTVGEDIVAVIPQKPPKPADTYCVTCRLPIFAIDKLFGEHQDHDVISIDAAVVNLKEKLDEFMEAAEEKAYRTEEFVTELEDAFNTVEENCAKEEKYLEEQHEEVMKLLLSQYTEMTQVLEEEKKMKLEHLCDQMVHYRCSIDSTKEAAEKTRESFELDDLAFLKSFRMINDRVISALETAISLDLKPSWCSSLEDLAVKSSRSGFESLKNLPVPHSPTVVPQEPNTATSTTITVYWTVAEEDVIDYFQVYCVEHSEGSRELSGSTAEEYKMAVKESYCVLDNLEPSRRYLVWVMAVNFAGCSLPSEKVMIQTVPAAPMINAEDCTVCWDSATIRWTSGDLDTIDFFILEFHKQNYHQKSKFRSMARIRGCEQTVSLPPLENFLFFVKAVNNLGCSDTSKPALISTKSTRFHLNKETVPPSMQLSEDGTVIHFDDQAMENENPLTECRSVLGETLPPRGQHYWEVTVDRCEAYRIGVTYLSTRSCSLGRSNKSWCMRYYATAAGHRYEFLHNSTSHDVLLTEFPTSVGVFVDCDSGQLSFFNAHNGQLLHTFKHQFTDFICPAFVVEKPGFLSLCTGIELPKFAKCSKC